MRALKLLPLLFLTLVSCGNENLDPIPPGPELPGEGEGEPGVDLEPILIFRNAQPQWVLDIGQEACDVWTRHGLPFALTDDPETAIRLEHLEVTGGIGGVFTPEAVYVIDSEELAVLNQSCVIAAELARIIGMVTNDGNGGAGGLLGLVIPFIPADEPCPWNDADQATLCDFSPASCQ